jgi:hydrogenase expression/formation protein HypC
MCLAVPGKILAIEETKDSRVGSVQFGGITRPVQLDFVPEAVVGDYVVTHVGFAISRVDAEEADRTFRILRDMGLLEGEGLDSKEESKGQDQAA